VITSLCAWLTTACRLSPPLTSGVVVGIDADPAAKVTVLLFDREGEPRAVAKVARTSSGERALETEHDGLRAVADRAGRRLPEVPPVLGLTRLDGRLALATGLVPGGPLSARYYRPGHVRSPERVATDFGAAGGWLTRFQEATRVGELVVGRDFYVDVVRPVFDRYRALVGWGAWEEQQLADLCRACDALDGVVLPRTAVHGDFTLGNLLFTGDRLTGVVDWERATPGGLPVLDVLKLAASYGAFLDRAGPVSRGALAGHPGWRDAETRWGGAGAWPNRVGLLYGFLGDGWFPDLVRGFVGEHLRRLGAPPESLSLFLPVFLADQATALENPAYRAGYRSVLHAHWQQSGRPDRPRVVAR
jgi:hypothetical protein